MCNACAPSVDPQAVDAFGSKLLDILNNAGLAMMISLGHRCRLFDTMAEMEAATSQQIAELANLNERYVREWLGAMVTSGIVIYNVNAATYRLHSLDHDIINYYYIAKLQ